MKQCYMRFPGGKKKAFTISYDDNITQDERLIKKMEQYHIKGTFNIIPGWFSKEDAVFPEGETYINVTEKKAKDLYDNSLVEVANHGYDHQKSTTVPTMQLMEDIIKCRRELENMYDRIITGYAYPYGLYNETLIQILKNAGISYARTVESTYEFHLPEDWLILNPTCHHAEPELMELAEKFLNDTVADDSYLFYVWGHTFEFDEQDNWHIVDDLFEKVANKEDVWYATNGEICNYHQKYKQLIFSQDGKRIYNPTDATIWLEIDNTVMSIRSGETKEL